MFKKAKAKTKPKPKSKAKPKVQELNEEDIELEMVDVDVEKLQKKAKERKSKEKFIRTRMWISLLVSKFAPDRGTIPTNIGNNILITNNQYSTKNNLSQVILVKEMSEMTPLMWMSDLIAEVKQSVSEVTVDITVKCYPYEVDTKQSGMQSRLRMWTSSAENPLTPKYVVRRVQRCLFTYNIVKAGAKLYKGYTFVIVRAKDGLHLSKGISAVEEYLASIDATYKRLESGIEEYMRFLLLMCDTRPSSIKDISPVIYSQDTLAQSLPGIQGYNSQVGVLFGFDIISCSPYFINFKGSSNAKNIFIEANSGFGKTFMAESWIPPFYADGFNIVMMDLKGTEFEAITKALHGNTISMRSDTPYYINTFVWDSDEKFDREAADYARHQVRISKEKMMIMANLEGEEANRAESLIDEFLHFLYEMIGARIDNENTWTRTSELNPYSVFEYFEKYISNEVQNKYPKVAKKVLERLRIYMSRSGSSSTIFGRPLQYQQVLTSRVLRFDFGVLEESSDQDPVLFRLHVLDMSIVNDSFVSYKKKLGQWTMKILEESQVADDYLLRIYTREITLRRAQNQVTVLLGNSMVALYNNPVARPMLDNMNILCMGAINKSSRKFLIEDFGLTDEQSVLLNDIQVNGELNHTFLLVNRMESDSTTALIQAVVPKEVANSSLFRVVDTE